VRLLVDVSQAPRVDPAEIAILWSVTYWDGPLRGILAWHSAQYWFACVNDYWEDELAPRIFAIMALTPEQLADETFWHERFVAEVQTPLGTPSYQSSAEVFYEAYRRRGEPQYMRNPIVGWFRRP
jgi:hypothetical protein